MSGLLANFLILLLLAISIKQYDFLEKSEIEELFLSDETRGTSILGEVRHMCKSQGSLGSS